MLPNFFVIGAGKSGTTSLHAYLGAHPQIHMSAIKEPNHFAPVDLSDVGHRHSLLVADRGQYEALFESDAPLRGESSGAYTQFPRRPGVAERIHAAVPDARLIYLVRDPIDRIRAFYMQRASMGRYPGFEAALGDIGDPANDYVCASRYMTQIDQYLPHFDRGQILVVDHDELRERRRETLGSVFAFIGAEPFWTDAYERRANVSGDKRRYSRTYAAVMGTPPVRRAAAALPESARERIGSGARRMLRRSLPEPEIGDDIRLRLEAILRPEAERLREFTGMAFAGWSI